MVLWVIASTLLREGRRAGWYAILVALVIGGTFELVMGALWFDHGLPLFRLLCLADEGSMTAPSVLNAS